MTVRRVDSWQVKPGQFQAFTARIAAFADAAKSHGVAPVTLLRTSSGGLEAGAYHAFADWESMEAYGAFTDAAMQDEQVQATFAALFAEDAPAVSAGSSQMVKLGAFGAEEPLNQPGVAAIVRSWAVAPGQHSVVTDNIERVANLYGHTNGHWNVWDVLAAGTVGGPQVLTAAVFPNMTELGAYSDDMRRNPRVAELIAGVANLDHPPRMLGATIVRVVTY